MHLYNFFVCGPKFTGFLFSNVGGAAVDQLLFECSMCRPVPEIFAIKVESCQKSSRNLEVFALPNFRGRAFRKLYARYHPCLAPRRLEKFHQDIPTSPDVIGVHTLNFKPNFKFSRLQFFVGPLSPVCCALARLGQSLARVKIWFEGAAPSKSRNIVLKNVHLGESICTSITFSYVDKSSSGFFVQPVRGCSWSKYF